MPRFMLHNLKDVKVHVVFEGKVLTKITTFLKMCSKITMTVQASDFTVNLV